MAWDDERVALLKKLWAEGLSASQIASKMGGVTRNAVIGKVHRLGLSGRATPAKPQRGRAVSESVSLTVEKPFPSKSALTTSPEPEFSAPIILDSGDLTTVATLQRNMCKWQIILSISSSYGFSAAATPWSRPHQAFTAGASSSQAKTSGCKLRY